MGLFAQKVQDATPSEYTSRYFEEGVYPIVQLDQFKFFKSKKPGREGVEMVAIVCDILESNSGLPAGTTGVNQTLNSMHPGAADDCKRFINAIFATPAEAKAHFQKLLGQPVSDSDLAEVLSLEGLSSEAQPARGRLLALEVYPKVSQKTGKTFTKHIWRALPEDVQAKAAELRAKAGLPPLR